MAELSTTYIGHQSWLVSAESTHILIDPVLTRGFGFSEHLEFTVFPHREVLVDRLPAIAAVVLTNEHLDHFHIPSLKLLPPTVEVYLPDTAPAVVFDALDRLSLRHHALRDAEVAMIGPIQCRLLAGPADSPKWEHRVHAAHLRTDTDRGVLIQSDNAIDYAKIQRLDLAPRVFIATNNAQVPHVEGSGAFDNLLAPTAEGHLGGLSILNSVVNLPTAQLPGVHYVLLSGAGYTIDPHGRSMFKWTNPQQLSRIARNLSFGAELVGLDPGQTLTATGEITNSDFVVLGSTEPGTAAAPLDEVLAKPRAILPPAATDELTILVDDILAELNGIAPVLINSRFGRALLNVNTYLSGPTGPVRFALHLRHGDHAATIGFDVNTSAFTRIEGDLRDCAFTIPFGMDVYARDLLGALRGELQIWELATAGTAQWFVGDRFDSPVAFFYEVLSEQVRPDLARELYARAELLK